ncbi:MAG TPA: hypothetical protein EYQ86_06620 [Bacteroidetes bacterium]|nr:hypothetical protein [Bacteroidota bacterium]
MVKKVQPKKPITPIKRVKPKKEASFFDQDDGAEDQVEDAGYQNEDELSWLEEAVENEGPKRIDKNRISDPEVFEMLAELEKLKGSPLTSDIVDEFIMDKDIVNRDIDIQHTITVYDQVLEIDVWDHQKEDGDRISLYLNGVLILDDHLLKREKKKLKIKLIKNQINQLR